MRRLLVGSVMLFAARTAFAEPAQADAVIAQSLFDEGRTLLAAGRVKEACVKFAESQRLDPGGGTLLNLALCHEREGRIATASAELEAATAQAIKDGRHDRETIARDHFAALQPRLPKVIVEVRGATPDETIAIDGHPLPRAAWGTPTAVDPGDHEIEAGAGGKKTVQVRFRAEEKTTSRVPVRALESDPNASSAPPTSAAAVASPVGTSTWPVVHLDAQDPDALLEEQRRVSPGAVVVTQGYVMVDDGTRWFEACRAPCDRKLDPQYAYRVNGKGIMPSKPFTIPGGTERVEVEAKTGSAAQAVVSGTLGALGIIGLAGGLVCLILGYGLNDQDSRQILQPIGWTGLAGGAVLTAGGIVLGLGATTDVHARAVR